MDVKILLVDDDETICGQIQELLNDETINGNKIKLDYKTNFNDSIEILKQENYDLVILDLFHGKPEEGNEDRPGEAILEHIKETCFIPVIFFTGLVKPIEHLQSDIVRVVRKSDTVEALKAEIEDVFNSKLPFIKQKLNQYIRESMRSYFWDFIHPNQKLLKTVKDEVSPGYLILRRLATSLSKENIKNILGDTRISSDKAHPMEFYIFPPVQKEFETGDFIKIKDTIFVILTPSCDFILRKEERNAKIILLAECIPLTETDEYKNYSQKQNSATKDQITRLIEGRKGDRYFFIPKAPFVDNSILDFQRMIMVPYGDLKKYPKLAKLDDPFAQSMTSFFIRYYMRIGYPDIDSEHILKTLS